MNEIVKYSNYVNQLHFTGFTAQDLNFFIALCAKAKEKGEEVLTFSFDEVKRVSGYAKKKASTEVFVKDLKRMNDKLLHVDVTIIQGKVMEQFVLFTTFRTDAENNKLTIRVNPDFSFLLNELTKNFTRFELSEFVQLESKYSKNLYRLLKQYRKTGTYTVEAEKFRELMDCPKSYPNMEFMRTCVNTAVKELSNGYFKDLKVEPIRAKKRGAPIVAYTFTFKKSHDVPGQTFIDNLDPETVSKPPAKSDSKNRFNNFPQRGYDFNDLEGALLKRDLNREK